MKLKLVILSLVAFAATSTIVMARADAPARDNSPATTPAATTEIAPAATAATVAPATDAAAPAAPATAADTTTPAAATPAADAASSTAAPAAPAASTAPAPAQIAAVDTTAATAPAADAASAAAPAQAATNAPAAVTPPADASAATNTAPAHDPNAVIPLIVMDEVPLTDAIKNLARQAGLNYMLDPKINYGGVKPDGTPNVQPTISLRWENLTADQALNAVLKTYNLTIVDDPKTKIALITVKDPAAPDPLVTKIIQLKYSDASNMVDNVKTVLLDKRSKVLADGRTSQLILVATDKEIAEVDQLVARLDTQTKEVLIEAKLVELSKNPTTTKGIDWSGTLQAQHVNWGNGVPYATPPTVGNPGVPGSIQYLGGPPGGVGTITNIFTGTPPTPSTPGLLSTVLQPGTLPMIQHNTQTGFDPSPFFLNADGVSAVLSFLNTEADAKVLSTPRAVTLDNQEAVLSVTTAEPIFKTTAGTQGSPGGAEITYTNLGTILHVTPRISANNTINLRVMPEVSSLGGTITKTVSGLVSQADFFDIRKMDTHVLIPSGNTLVMGGLVSDASTKGNTKVPLLGDIPLLGWAFRQEAKTQNKRNLIIFITPTIVENEDFQPAQTDFLKTKMDDKPSAKFGAWDSGNPQDWSKLFGGKKTEPDALDNAK